MTVRAARVLDGKGGSLANGTVEVRGGKIVAVDQRTGPVTHDLGDVTLLPGLMDVHVHIGYHFGKDGRAENDGETPGEMALYGAENAWTTLINGFTTVQSVGAANDKELRDAIARGVLPGPLANMASVYVFADASSAPAAGVASTSRAGWARSRTASSQRCTAARAASSIPPCTKASGSRCSRRWPAEPPS